MDYIESPITILFVFMMAGKLDEIGIMLSYFQGKSSRAILTELKFTL